MKAGYLGDEDGGIDGAVVGAISGGVGSAVTGAIYSPQAGSAASSAVAASLAGGLAGSLTQEAGEGIIGEDPEFEPGDVAFNTLLSGVTGPVLSKVGECVPPQWPDWAAEVAVGVGSGEITVIGAGLTEIFEDNK